MFNLFNNCDFLTNTMAQPAPLPSTYGVVFQWVPAGPHQRDVGLWGLVDYADVVNLPASLHLGLAEYHVLHRTVFFDIEIRCRLRPDLIFRHPSLAFFGRFTQGMF